jgi:streptogramin lyase
MDFQELTKIDAHGKIKSIATGIANKNWTQSTIENQNAVMSIWDDNHENIYTAVYSAGQVKKFDVDGNAEIVLQTNWPWAPSGGMVSANEELWVLETSVTNAVRVERITTDNRRIIY